MKILEFKKLHKKNDDIKLKFKEYIKKVKNNDNNSIFQNCVYKEYYTSYKGEFKKYFKKIKKLGEGSHGVVRLVKNIENNKLFAAKVIFTRDEEVINQTVEEFKFFKNLNFNEIIKFYDLFIDITKGKIYWVMEYFEGLSLYEFIMNNNYDEIFLKLLFKKLLIGVQFLHNNGIVHRDLKPDNILISQDGCSLKIIDFNVSKNFNSPYNIKYKSNYLMLTYTGTLAFKAPETFNKSIYNEMVDYWSLGCILYFMLIKKQPFYKESVKSLITQIQDNNYDKQSNSWNKLSLSVRDLIKQFLQNNPNIRFNSTQALSHQWLLQYKPRQFSLVYYLENFNRKLWGIISNIEYIFCKKIKLNKN